MGLANKVTLGYIPSCRRAGDTATRQYPPARGVTTSRRRYSGQFVSGASKAATKSHDVTALPAPATPPANSAKIAFGKVLPPQQQLLLFSPADWEAFIEEWATAVGKQYVKIGKIGGPGDMGVDVAGFGDDKKFRGKWDCYQCKFYKAPVTVDEGCEEIGKLIWHCFNDEFVPPQKYFFVAPKGVAPLLKKLIAKDKLKAELKKRWNKVCKTNITSIQEIPLEGKLLAYLEKFDFSIFDYKEALEIVDEHRQSKYFAARFGGGLPDRPPVGATPPHTGPTESRYIEQLYDAYSERENVTITDSAQLGSFPEQSEHLDRQRESFYHAEALRNFARDTVPTGTFEHLQQEILDGVIEVEKAVHKDGLDRANSVTQAAAALQLTSNGLITVLNVKDRKGICHQLANVDKLKWKKT